PHHGIDQALKPDSICVKHRASPVSRKPITSHVNHVDVRRPNGDAFGQYFRALIDQRTKAAIHNLGFQNRAVRYTEPRTLLPDEIHRLLIRDAFSGYRVISIVATTGFLPEPSTVEQQ